MSTTLFLKFLLPTAGVGGLVGVGVGVNHWITEKTNPKAILIGVASVTPPPKPNADDKQSLHSYKCRLKTDKPDTSTAVDCVLQLFAHTTDAKNQETFTKLKEFTSPVPSVTLSSLKVDKSIFKVQVPESFLTSFTDNTSKLEIISSDAAKTVLGTLDYLFGYKSTATPSLQGQSPYYVAKAVEFTNADSTTTPTETAKPTTTESFKCSTNSTFVTSDSTTCELYEFASNMTADASSKSAQALEFTKASEVASTITKDKWYLIKYSTPQPLPSADITNIFAHKITTADSASVTNNQKTVKLQKISPVVVTEETKNRVFFLKDHTS